MKTNILLIFLFLITTASLNAETAYFGNDELLGPYPSRGSLEEQQDLDQLLYIQNKRTKEQCAEAALQKDSSLGIFFGGKGLLTDQEVKFYNKKLRSLTIKTGIQIYFIKKKFNRTRPYITSSQIKPCIELESSPAYPSGHTTLARVYARILSAALPEREEKFMKRADEIAFNRVLGGVHHPSDIVAGKKLGDIIADDYLSTLDHLYKLKTNSR